MTDIALVWDDDLQAADIGLDGADLATDDGFWTAVELSLFLYRRANPDDPLPSDDGDLGGWYGDVYNLDPTDRIGSRLWLLRRSISTDDIPGKAKTYIQEALQWLIDDGATDTISVVTMLTATGDTDELDTLYFKIVMYDDAGKDIATFKYSGNWQAMNYLRMA
jgi:phage gp46-like protein